MPKGTPLNRRVSVYFASASAEDEDIAKQCAAAGDRCIVGVDTIILPCPFFNLIVRDDKANNTFLSLAVLSRILVSQVIGDLS